MVVKGLQRANAVKEETEDDRPNPPPMIKLVSQEWSFGCLGIKSQENSYLPRVQTGPYIEILGTVICPNNLPKICGSQRARS